MKYLCLLCFSLLICCVPTKKYHNLNDSDLYKNYTNYLSSYKKSEYMKTLFQDKNNAVYHERYLLTIQSSILIESYFQLNESSLLNPSNSIKIESIPDSSLYIKNDMLSILRDKAVRIETNKNVLLFIYTAMPSDYAWDMLSVEIIPKNDIVFKTSFLQFRNVGPEKVPIKLNSFKTAIESNDQVYNKIKLIYENILKYF